MLYGMAVLLYSWASSCLAPKLTNWPLLCYTCFHVGH